MSDSGEVELRNTDKYEELKLKKQTHLLGNKKEKTTIATLTTRKQNKGLRELKGWDSGNKSFHLRLRGIENRCEWEELRLTVEKS